MQPGERNDAGRRAILEAFDAICPGILGNPFVPHWPHPPQARFLGLHLKPRESSRVFEALYGGAAGGGKSDALLMSLAQFAWRHGEFRGIAFRRTYADLALPGALMDRALSWWLPRGVHWQGDTKTFTFPSGAKVTFAYLQHEQDHLRYQGAEFHQTCWDELTQFPLESQYSYVGLSRVRRREGCTIPLRTLSASNPGGPGHDWVARKFIGGQDPITGLLVQPQHDYVPARIVDNPSIDQPAYLAGLQDLHPTVRAQLMEGDWRARDPGDYFRAEWFGPMLDPELDAMPRGEFVQIRWWDLAASENPEAARTAGVLMARLRSGVRAIVHCNSFRATPGKRDDAIVRQAHLDGRHTIVGIEIEGGSGGPAQFEALAKRLGAEGFRVVGARPRVGRGDLTDQERATMLRTPVSDSAKQTRADPVASCLERGYQRRGECPDTGGPWWGEDAGKPLDQQRDGLRIFVGTWTRAYLDIVEGFPNGATCDEVDATSGAWSWLEAHPFGLRAPMVQGTRMAPAEAQNLHPEDRPEPARDRGPAGRWRP